jgi:hypothetical protein
LARHGITPVYERREYDEIHSFHIDGANKLYQVNVYDDFIAATYASVAVCLVFFIIDSATASSW